MSRWILGFVLSLVYFIDLFNGVASRSTFFHNSKKEFVVTNLKESDDFAAFSSAWSGEQAQQSTHKKRSFQQLLLSPKVLYLELSLMHKIQKILNNSLMQTVSIIIHYSFSTKLLTPLLALLSWTISIPKGASITCFLCLQDIVNVMLKWFIQRPRPLIWYKKYQELDKTTFPTKLQDEITRPDSRLIIEDKLQQYNNKKKISFSFPSAHTQFFAGFVYCSLHMSNDEKINSPTNLMSRKYSITMTFSFLAAFFIGVTRSFLGVHWPTDTLFGMILGSSLGLAWAKLNPFHELIKNSYGMIGSTAVASGVTIILIISCIWVQQNFVKNFCSLSSFQEDHVNNGEHQLMHQTKIFIIREKIAAFSTIWSLLSLSPLLNDNNDSSIGAKNSIEFSALRLKVTRIIIGFGGLGVMNFMKKCIQQNKDNLKKKEDSSSNTSSKMNALTSYPILNTDSIAKVFFYVILNLWTFLVVPFVSDILVRRK